MEESYLHVDTIGLGDTKLQYNDKEILNQIEKEVVKISTQHDINTITAIVVP